MTKKRVFTVLAIDGGGVRGIIPSKLLMEIEARTGKPIAELFDLVAGTSTGSIVAAGLTTPSEHDKTKPKYTAENMRDFYINEASKIFPAVKYRQLMHLLPTTSGFYDPKAFEDILEDRLGNAKVGDSLTNVMFPAMDIKNYKPVWVKSFKGRRDPKGWKTMSLVDLIRGGTSAPTIFPAKYAYTHPNPKNPEITERHAFIDGSFFAGSIARRAYTAAKRIAPPDAEIIVVHLGTGTRKASLTPEEYNKISPIGLIRGGDNHGSAIGMAIEMSNIDINEDLRDEIGAKLFSFDNYITPGEADSPSIAIDNAEPGNLVKLEALADDIIDNRDEEIETLCKMLEQKLFNDDLHLKSKESFQNLFNMLDEAPTLKELEFIHRKIIKYSSKDMNFDKITKEEEGIAKFAKKLQEKHIVELERLFNVIRDDKRVQVSDSLNRFKKYGSKLLKPFKRNKNSDNSKNIQKKPPNPKP